MRSSHRSILLLPLNTWQNNLKLQSIQFFFDTLYSVHSSLCIAIRLHCSFYIFSVHSNRVHLHWRRITEQFRTKIGSVFVVFLRKEWFSWERDAVFEFMNERNIFWTYMHESTMLYLCISGIIRAQCWIFQFRFNGSSDMAAAQLENSFFFGLHAYVFEFDVYKCLLDRTYESCVCLFCGALSNF